jgi:hypothetical protein
MDSGVNGSYWLYTKSFICRVYIHIVKCDKLYIVASNALHVHTYLIFIYLTLIFYY